MPGRDGMGPMGQGAMTGRGMGGCAGAQVDLPPGAGFGRGRGGRGRGGRGRGGQGRGWRHQFNATGLTGWQRAQNWPVQQGGSPPDRSDAQELAALKQQAEDMERTLAELKSRIQELGEPA